MSALALSSPKCVYAIPNVCSKLERYIILLDGDVIPYSAVNMSPFFLTAVSARAGRRWLGADRGAMDPTEAFA